MLVKILVGCIKLVQSVIEQIRFVENQHGRHIVCFGYRKHTVDKLVRRLRVAQGNDQCQQIHVGGYHLRLLRPIHRFADDIVFAGQYRRDAFAIDFHTVSHGHGVGAFYAVQPDFSAHAGLDSASVVQRDQALRSGGFYYSPYIHFFNVSVCGYAAVDSG